MENELIRLFGEPYRTCLGVQAAMMADESMQRAAALVPEAFAHLERSLETVIQLARELAEDAEECGCSDPDDLLRLKTRLACVVTSTLMVRDMSSAIGEKIRRDAGMP